MSSDHYFSACQFQPNGCQCEFPYHLTQVSLRRSTWPFSRARKAATRHMSTLCASPEQISWRSGRGLGLRCSLLRRYTRSVCEVGSRIRQRVHHHNSSRLAVRCIAKGWSRCSGAKEDLESHNRQTLGRLARTRVVLVRQATAW